MAEERGHGLLGKEPSTTDHEVILTITQSPKIVLEE